MTVVEIDLRVGGRWRYVMVANSLLARTSNRQVRDAIMESGWRPACRSRWTSWEELARSLR